jgi:integrase
MATVVKARHPNARKAWTVRYMLDGRTKEESYQTKREALDRKVAVEHGQRTHTFVDARDGRGRFTDYAAGWINGLDRAPGTKASYLSVLNAQIAPVLGSRTLAQIAQDREGVWALIQGMTGSASRRKAALTVIKGACDEAVSAGKIPTHRLGTLSVSKDAVAQAVIVPVTKAQLEKLAAGLPADQALTVWLMRGCGLRISEALAVRLDGFRDDGKVLRISQQIGRDGRPAQLKARKVNEYREMPVPTWLWAKVQAHVAQFPAELHNGYLFGNGARITYKSYSPKFTRAAQDAGLPDLGCHQLRHLFASTLLAKGVPLTDVATWMGHRDVRITAAVYGHLLPSSWDRGRDALETL